MVDSGPIPPMIPAVFTRHPPRERRAASHCGPRARRQARRSAPPLSLAFIWWARIVRSSTRYSPQSRLFREIPGIRPAQPEGDMAGAMGRSGPGDAARSGQELLRLLQLLGQIRLDDVVEAPFG